MGQAGAMAAYDAIADWYEEQFLPTTHSGQDPIGVAQALRDLLGPGRGFCVELGCGTGIHASAIRGLGWHALGVDVSAGMLRHAHQRLSVALADAEHLPLRDESVPAIVAVMVHTDMPNYRAVLRDVARVLTPGGVFVHIGVHPAFCGGFADRGDENGIVIRPGYLRTYYTKDSWTDRGIRDKVGAMHRPLPELLHAMLDAGLILERFQEGGAPTPTTLSVRARRSV